MKLNAYSVLDEKANVYAPPIFLTTHAAAIRAFSDACRDPKTMYFQHPEDFRFYFMGTFDQSTGEMFPEDKPTFMSSALDHKPVDVISNGLNEAGKHFIEKK